MNKTGMTRVPTPTKPVLPDVYVLHLIPEQTKEVTSDFKVVFRKWKKAIKRTRGSAAIWRGPNWAKLHATDYYPSALREPFVKL